MKRQWKDIVAFLPKAVLRDANTYGQQVFDNFWKNELKLMRNENKKEDIFLWVGVSECLMQIVSEPFRFTDEAATPFSQLWDMHV